MDRRDRFHGLLAVLLLAIGVIVATLWPPFRTATLAGFHTLARPFKRLSMKAVEEPRPTTPQQKIAAQARSMEFRVQQFPVDPALLKSWCTEWQAGPIQQQTLLCLLLRQLPETTAKDSSMTQKQNLFQSIHELAAGNLKAQPNNSFFHLADSLAFFYSGQEAASVVALKEALQIPRVDASLEDLNESEHALWLSEQKPGMLLPVTHRNWSLQLERPFHMMSRGVALQQRSLLQKYNIERAVELSLLHLGLATRLAEAGWTPADQANARGMALRAMEPFSTKSGVDPSPEQIETNFLGFLEDQGDKVASAKASAWISTLATQEATMNSRLPSWRYAQSLAIWNASTVLGSLFLQTASLFLAWITIAWVSRKVPTPADQDYPQRNFAGLAFGLAPILWTVTSLPLGGTYLLLGLASGWVIWWGLMAISHEQVSFKVVTHSIASSLVTLLTTTIFVTAAAALAVQYRQHQFQAIAHGWLR